MAMFGADVGQLRALARSFDDAATRLDQDRLSVGNAIRVQAWVGPVAVRFRAEWDSAHSVKVARAAARLHDAASALRRNADDQERTSAVNGAASIPRLFEPRGAGGPIGPGGGLAALITTGFVATVGEFAQGVRGVLDVAAKTVEIPFSIAEYGHRVGAVMLSGRGAEVAGHLDDVMAASKFGGLFDMAGKTIGALSVGLGVVDTITKAAEGDTEGAILAGVKTGLGIAAFAPPPVGPIAGAIGIGITVGELLSENPAITKFAGDVVGGAWDAIASGVDAGVRALPDVAHGVAQAVGGAGAAAGKFLGGVAAAAKKVWPW